MESSDYLLLKVWKENDMKEINPQANRVQVVAQSEIPPFTLTLSPGAIVLVTVELFLFSHFDHLVYSRDELRQRVTATMALVSNFDFIYITTVSMEQRKEYM